MNVEALINKIIAAYKEHYDFPWQGESHMRDCLADVLEEESRRSFLQNWPGIEWAVNDITGKRLFPNGLPALTKRTKK